MQTRHQYDMAKHMVYVQGHYMYIIRRVDYPQAHHNHFQYMLRQQYEWMRLQNTLSQTYQQKETIYLHATNTVR